MSANSGYLNYDTVKHTSQIVLRDRRSNHVWSYEFDHCMPETRIYKNGELKRTISSIEYPIRYEWLEEMREGL